jgi:L-malate glycosyltransferase
LRLVGPRRKILFLITSLEDRGAENAALRLALGLNGTGKFTAGILALKEGTGRLRLRAREAGLDSLSCLGRTTVLSFAGTVGAVRRTVLAGGIDVLYSFLFHPNIVSRMAGMRAGRVLVVNGERSMPGGKNSYRSVLRRWTSSLADGHTAVSDAVRRAMIAELGVPPDRVRTIRNGVDVSGIPVSPCPLGSPSRVRLLTIGALSPEKSFETLIDALALLGEPGATLTILGDGPGRPALEARIRAAGLAGRVRLPGHTADIRTFLAESDVYVQSSVREGLSNALLSAMAAGLTVVATDVGGTAEAILEGETGILVPPKDPAALARGIRRILDCPEEGRLLGGNARRKVTREFASERELAETIDWIDELLQRRSEGTVPATYRT